MPMMQRRVSSCGPMICFPAPRQGRRPTAVDDTQYLTITTGWGSAYALSAGYGFDEKVTPTVGKVVTFKLGGTGVIKEPDLPVIDRVTTAQPFGDDELLAEGTVLYARNCMVCHGPLAISSGVLPDLRWSPIAASAEAWSDVVLEGKLAENGMVSFAEYLTPEDAEAIRAYVIRQARNDMAERSAASAP